MSADPMFPTTKGQDQWGDTPYRLTLSRVEACQWGVEIKSRVAQAINPVMPWYGDAGAPAMSTCRVIVNGVDKTALGVYKSYPYTNAEGNLAFTPAVLGC